jgi:hypothetical protein
VLSVCVMGEGKNADKICAAPRGDTAMHDINDGGHMLFPAPACEQLCVW